MPHVLRGEGKNQKFNARNSVQEVLALEKKLEENNPSEPHKEILHTELRIKKRLEEIIE